MEMDIPRKYSYHGYICFFCVFLAYDISKKSQIKILEYRQTHAQYRKSTQFYITIAISSVISLNVILMHPETVKKLLILFTEKEQK